jgi:copper chaperone NosL
MTISDPRFAAQLVTRKGRILPFDDIGGLAAFMDEEKILPSEVHGLWVNSFLQPDVQLDATTARFLQSDRLRTPMGSQLAAFPPGREVDSLLAELGGVVLRWEDVLALPVHPAEGVSPSDETPAVRP